MAKLALGIDLGTTHSVVAVFEQDGPRVLLDGRDQALIPSVVALDDTGHLLVGHAAVERQARGCEAVSRFKSDLSTDKRYRFGARELSATVLSSLVLRELRELAEAALGEPVTAAVISVPAWFREPQRRATVEAAHLAGLDVLRLVNEPTAAALDHGLRCDDELVTVAVLDLGGGTFDITLLELFDGVADVRGTVGDVHLGGEDVTDLIVGWANEQTTVISLDASIQARLRVSAEQAKRTLSTHPEATVQLGEQRLPLTRQVLEEITVPFRRRLRQCMRDVLMQTGLRASNIDTVLLAGGATRMPLVHAVAEEVFGQPPVATDDVDLAIARGAAVQAGLVLDHSALREKLVSDVLTHSLGLAVQRQWGDEVLPDRFDPVLHRGTTLPATRASEYYAVHPKQTHLKIRIYEGEHRDVRQNQLLGELEVLGLPEQHTDDTRAAVEIRFTHDASGLLEVEATNQATGEQVKTVIQRGGLHCSDEDAEAALAELQSLKTHPRDLLPNRWMLERGNRVVELLTGQERAALDQQMDGFEMALNQGDPERIDLWRSVVAASVRVAVERAGLELDL